MAHINWAVLPQTSKFATQRGSGLGLGFASLIPPCGFHFISLNTTDLWLAGNAGVEKKMETIIMGYIGATIRIHSFIPGP